MSVLSRCVRVFGQVHLNERPLRVNTYKRAFSEGFNLYDASGLAIFDGCYIRGVPNVGSLVENHWTTTSSARLTNTLTGNNYFWLGPLHNHFGHFLLGCISRLWPIYGYNVGDFQFVYSHGPDPDRLFEVDYSRSIFEGLGISRSQILKIDDRVAIESLIVAEPSFVENHSVHSSFLKTVDRICEGLRIDRRSIQLKNQVVYVTKENVRSGVRGILNEPIVVGKLRERGVSVHSPEQLSFSDQIIFWNSYSSYIGFAGSSFHMSAFSGCSKFCTISHDYTASGNQVLLDSIGSKDHTYLHASSNISRFGPSTAFSEAVVLNNPDRFADAIMEYIARLNLRAGDYGQKSSPEPRSSLVTVIPDEPFGYNICRGARASQSSCNNLMAVEASSFSASASINGVLTGGVQSSTGTEPFSWWQVEFDEHYWVYEVRIFNGGPVLNSSSSLGPFSIQISLDGFNWENAFVSNSADGGDCACGAVFRWNPDEDLVARFMRVLALHERGIHLDQVEVFGESVVINNLEKGTSYILFK